VQLRSGQSRDAESALTQALARIPGSGKILWGLGVIAALHGDSPQAADRLQRAVDLLPEWPGSYSTLGVFYYQTGQYDKAREVLSRFKGSHSSGGFDVSRIEQALATAPQTSAAAPLQPLPVPRASNFCKSLSRSPTARYDPNRSHPPHLAHFASINRRFSSRRPHHTPANDPTIPVGSKFSVPSVLRTPCSLCNFFFRLSPTSSVRMSFPRRRFLSSSFTALALLFARKSPRTARATIAKKTRPPAAIRFTTFANNPASLFSRTPRNPKRSSILIVVEPSGRRLPMRSR